MLPGRLERVAVLDRYADQLFVRNAAMSSRKFAFHSDGAVARWAARLSQRRYPASAPLIDIASKARSLCLTQCDCGAWLAAVREWRLSAVAE
jgi:hypothetical protein